MKCLYCKGNQGACNCTTFKIGDYVKIKQQVLDFHYEERVAGKQLGECKYYFVIVDEVAFIKTLKNLFQIYKFTSVYKNVYLKVLDRKNIYENALKMPFSYPKNLFIKTCVEGVN